MLGINTKRISGVIFTISIIFLLGSLGNDSFAQQVTTPSGSRSMVQKGIIAEGSGGIIVTFDLRYTVAWEARTCEQPRPYGTRPQAVAWVSNYTVEGVEYKDEYFSGDAFGQGTLRSGLEIVRLNSGIVAEVTSLESGESDMVDLPDQWIHARPKKIDVCDMDATEIFHYELSRDEHEVQIKNTDQDRSNEIRIKGDLGKTIALKAIDSKMNKAQVAADRGDKDRAQQIAMNARNLCPGGSNTAFGETTECEKEISKFLEGLSDNGANTNKENQRQANTDNNLGEQESSNDEAAEEVSSNPNNSSSNEMESYGNQQNTFKNARESEERKAIDEHNTEILQRAQTITDQAEDVMWGEEENNEFSSLEGEISTYDRMIGALEQRRMDNLSPKERQELETYLLSMNATQVLATLAGGGNLLDSEASLEGVVEAGVNLLEARAERKAAEREAERKRKEAIQKMEKEREERKKELQRKKEQEAQSRMQYFSNNILNPFDKDVIGEPVAPTAKEVKPYYDLSHKSLQKGNLNSGIRHMERGLDNLETKNTPEAGIIQYQLAWMYSEDDDLISAAEYADTAAELTEDTPAEDIVTEFANGIDKAYEKQERQDFLAQKRTGIPEKLEDYLDKYPQGEYKDEAENLIKKWRMERQKKMQSLRNSYQYHEEKAAKYGRNAGISIASGIGIPLIGLLVFTEEDEDGQLQGPEWVGIAGLGVMAVGGVATLIFVSKQGKHSDKASNIEKEMRELRKQKFSANIKFNSKYEVPLLSFRVNF